MTVYFVQCGPGGPVKIGCTTDDVFNRLRQMQTGSPYDLALLAVMAGGPAEEAELHARFAYLAVRGEWFWPAKPLLDFVATLGPPPERPRFILAPSPPGNPIRDMRLKMNMTQAELAAEFGMQQSHVCRMEKAPTVHKRTVLAMEGLLRLRGIQFEPGALS